MVFGIKGILQSLPMYSQATPSSYGTCTTISPRKHWPIEVVNTQPRTFMRLVASAAGSARIEVCARDPIRLCHPDRAICDPSILMAPPKSTLIALLQNVLNSTIKYICPIYTLLPLVRLQIRTWPGPCTSRFSNTASFDTT